MSKTKKKLTKEEKLAKDRLRKRQKYKEIKSNPELFKIKQEKDRKGYVLRKQQKKICSINEMSARAQREQRKRWRKNSLKYKKKKRDQRKVEEILVNNSSEVTQIEKARNVSPDSEANQFIVELDPFASLEQPATTQVNKNSSNRKFRYKVNKTINRLQAEINQLKKEKRKLQIKLKKKHEVRQKSLEDTVEKNVHKVIQEINSGEIEEVKKRLIFNETFTHQIKLNYKKLDKKDKRSFATIVQPNDARLRKHKLITKFPFNIRKKLEKQENKNKTLIQSFFEDDSNSSMSAGKKEFIKRGNIKKQKRYLNNSLKSLHKKFCKEHGMISYAVFCKNRPYWIVFPKNNRDTCQCKLHSNIDLLIKALKKSNIISENSSTDVLNSLCCDLYNENCLGRSCADCKRKTLQYNEFNNSEEIDYFQWTNEKLNYTVKDEGTRVKNVTAKKTNRGKPRDIINLLDNTLKIFFHHVRNIVTQHQAITELKKSLKDTEVLIHVDFSENYCLKYHEEIQSFHFGGSRGQVSLHTVVLYYIDGDKGLSTKSICTMSQCTNHDASAIWAHIIPLLNRAKQLVPSLKRVHFLSDSPSSQYRNRFIFYMMTKMHLQIPSIEIITWNYQEAGHGKGAPDGVGAVIKRTADSHVKFGGDVGSFDDFVRLIQEKIQNVEITVIPVEEIIKKKFPIIIPTFKGTTKVHQVLWSSELPFTVALRCLSCFVCLNSFLPCGHQKHLGTLDMGFGQDITIDLPSVMSPDFSRLELPDLEVQLTTDRAQNDDLTVFEINSDTICNNIEYQATLLNEFDGTLFSPLLTSPKPIPSDSLVEKEKPKILSNIPFDYECFKAQKSSKLQAVRKIKTEHQQDFEEFLKAAKLQRVEQDISITNKEETDTKENNNKENLMDNILDDMYLKYNVDDWVIVKYRITENKSNFVHYVGKIMDKTILTHEYKVGFLRKSFGRSMKFVWPDITDEDVVTELKIIQKLNQPHESRRGQYSFDDLPNVNYK